MLLIPVFAVIALAAGIAEWQLHKKHIRNLPLRININGIRGKSTVTRLVTGIIMEDGYRAIGKTTGTSARLMYWYSSEEEPIHRRAEGPNISEQKRIVKKVSELGSNALISECMAVNPDYQVIFQEKLLQANISVIVNVLEDHMDVMGPTLDEVAESFTSSIPYGGHLIINDGPYTDFFKKEANKRATKVIVADNSKVEESYLRQFDYMLFPENVSLALAVAEALGIDEDTAYRGMLKANPDPGAMRIREIKHNHLSAQFVNGFAANDSVSTLNIWENIKVQGYPSERLVVLMNCRSDRVDRTIQFSNDVLPYLPIDTLVLIGSTVNPIKDSFNRGDLQVNKLIDLQGYSTDEIYNHLLDTVNDNVIYGVGNIHGAAEPLVNKIQN